MVFYIFFSLSFCSSCTLRGLEQSFILVITPFIPRVNQGMLRLVLTFIVFSGATVFKIVISLLWNLLNASFALHAFSSAFQSTRPSLFFISAISFSFILQNVTCWGSIVLGSGLSIVRILG